MGSSTARLLARLEQARSRLVRGERVGIAALLRTAGKPRFLRPASLIRFHDLLLFFRAFPQDAAVVAEAERLLSQCEENVEQFRRRKAPMDAFDPENVSGIAGTDIVDTFTCEVAAWLAGRFPADVTIDWEPEEQAARLGATLPRFLPLLDEDALVEADVPYLDWLHAASGGPDRDLAWLMQRFERLPLTPAEKTELYDSLGITLRWKLRASPVSRTSLRRPTAACFYHDGPFIARRDVSLTRELAAGDLPVRILPAEEGAAVLDMVRAAVTVRYRELWGTTRGDHTLVRQASIGRGCEVFLWGLPPERRLPLRAYLAGITVKNGVPINYIEAISLFDWTEVGFNTFYAYRDGETAWIYAQVLRLLHQLLGVSCISVYPYQIGHGNDEAIASGAFWFYRKLGFRPGRPDLLTLVKKEEKKIAASRRYRTPAATLRKLAQSHVFYELPGATRGAWDRFSVRNLGLAVQRHMAERFHGDRQELVKAARASLSRALAIDPSGWTPPARRALDDFAVVLALAPDLDGWNAPEKEALARILRAKAGRDECDYLGRLQRHSKLRQTFLVLGSAPAVTAKTASGR